MALFQLFVRCGGGSLPFDCLKIRHDGCGAGW